MQKVDVQTRRLVGGAVCLDFANSVDWGADGTERPSHTDVLTAPEQLTSWGRRLGLVAPDVALRVSGRELSAARAVRAAVHGVFAAIATGARPDASAVSRLTREHAEATKAARLAGHSREWVLEWVEDAGHRVRFAVVLNAIDLLRDERRLERLRLCPGNNCGWLFLDTSGRRRWCSMEVCGSRAKMRRLYERQRGAKTDSGAGA